MWIYKLENYSYIALAYGQRQVLLSLLGFVFVVAVTGCWRRISVQSLLPSWLCFWIWMLPFSLLGASNQGAGVFSQNLRALRESAQSWLPPQAVSPCEVPYVNRISSDLPLLPQLSWHQLLLGVWLLLASTKAMSLLLQRIKLSAIAKIARSIDEPKLLASIEQWRHRYRLARAVSVRSSSAYGHAFTVGVLRPVIFLPEHLLRELRFTDIEAVLGHEFAHIKRYDDIFVSLQLVTKCLLFFNPLIWLSARRIASLRERRCDQLAILTGKLVPQSYAESLLRVAELQHHASFTSEAAAGFTSSVLVERINGVLAADNKRFSYLPMLGVIAGLLLLNIIFMPNPPETHAIRGDEAKVLFKNLGAVAPMPSLLGDGNFIDGSGSACELPKRAHYHPGADFVPGIDGDRAVRAIADGEVVAMTSLLPDVGITLQIKHRNDVVSTYVYLSAANVKSGDYVHAGERIGTLGNHHLHLEVHKDSRVVDPSALLNK